MQVAAQHSKTVSQRSRPGVEEWLFFDRIALHAAHISPGDIERSTPVIADLAHPRLPVGNGAAVPTRIAAYPVAIQTFDQLGRRLANLLVKHHDLRGYYL